MKQNKDFVNILWLPVLPLLLVFCFFLTWTGLSKVNFLYSFWYQHTALEEFIDFYAPQNRFKKNFELVDKQGRIEIFAEIVTAINNGGVGLGEIVYYDSGGDIVDTFLHDSERIHLEYVSDLVILFKYFSMFSLIWLLVLLIFLFFYSTAVPDLKKLTLLYLYVFLFIGVVVLIYGPENTFVLLHEAAFPDNHQWHFYYQDSLMTTLMMAPDLFAYIAGVWISISLLIFFVGAYFLVSYFSELKNK